MNRAVRDFAIVFIAMAFMMFFVLHARSTEQTRFYDAQGDRLGTAVPQGDGSVRYYDSRGELARYVDDHAVRHDDILRPRRQRHRQGGWAGQTSAHNAC
jgi:hypothetical protein